MMLKPVLGQQDGASDSGRNPINVSPPGVPVLPVARGFVSTAAAMEAVVSLIPEQHGLRSGFVARFTPGDERFEVLVAHNAPGGCSVPVGDGPPLPQHF
jgi:hypothetical protein